ncbi:TPA: hypothetical protein VBM32_002191 [Streptococcus agalactiae]|nr:hypothetical protein [Streptococcus agalactiae]
MDVETFNKGYEDKFEDINARYKHLQQLAKPTFEEHNTNLNWLHEDLPNYTEDDSNEWSQGEWDKFVAEYRGYFEARDGRSSIHFYAFPSTQVSLAEWQEFRDVKRLEDFCYWYSRYVSELWFYEMGFLNREDREEWIIDHYNNSSSDLVLEDYMGEVLSDDLKDMDELLEAIDRFETYVKRSIDAINYIETFKQNSVKSFKDYLISKKGVGVLTLTDEWVFEEGNKLGLEDLMDGSNVFFVELNPDGDIEDYDLDIFDKLDELWSDIWDEVPTESKNKSVYFSDSANDGELGYVSIEGVDSWDLDVASELLDSMLEHGVSNEEEAHDYLVSVSQAIEELTDAVSDIVSEKCNAFEKQTGVTIG